MVTGETIEMIEAILFVPSRWNEVNRPNCFTVQIFHQKGKNNAKRINIRNKQICNKNRKL